MGVWKRACNASHQLLAEPLGVAWFALLCLCSNAANGQTTSETRVALVVGNGTYASAPLANPARDAVAVARALRSVGFTVIEAHDVTKADFDAAIAQASDLMKGHNAVGLLYFAGHGLQLDWHNYMVPVDARLGSPADVRSRTVDVQSVVDAFRAAGSRVNIFVLDACRDSPFGAAADSKGLAPVDAPSGSVFAYATAPGNVASDGDASGENGLYTQFLVREMLRPGASVEDVFKRVRFQVRQLSRGQQIPWESTSLEASFSFRPQSAHDAAPSPQVALDEEIRDWKLIEQSIEPDDVFRFLRAHPSGSLSEIALARLERLSRSAIIAEALPGQVLPALTGQRLGVGDEFIVLSRDFVTGRELSRFNLTVTSIKGELVYINDGAMVRNLDGAEVKDFNGEYEPPLVTLPPTDIRLGSTVTSRTRFSPRRGPRVYREYVTRVVAYERVQTGAGTFQAYRLETQMTGEDGSTARSVRWIDPEWGIPLRIEWTGRENRYGQSWASVYEVISRRRGQSVGQSADAHESEGSKLLDVTRPDADVAAVAAPADKSERRTQDQQR